MINPRCGECGSDDVFEQHVIYLRPEGHEHPISGADVIQQVESSAPLGTYCGACERDDVTIETD